MLSTRIYALFIALLLSPSLHAQDKDEDQSLSLDSIAVTGTRIRAGGAQDINHFRSLAFDEGQMPRPESLTVEGLLSEHDLPLVLQRPCKQLFCLATEVMPANLTQRPHDRLFVGLGFTSNIDAKTWQRAPLNLIAVVDKSGSMDGEPLDLVRRSLMQIAKRMSRSDRLAIVLYGDVSEVYLASTEVASHRKAVLQAIQAIQSAGSTDMESGLKVGFAHALSTKSDFKGNTRVMLFTDEQPNVGATNASSFMGMANRASKKGGGMSTIGVGVQFDARLASKVGSVRGGNLFFVADKKQVETLFKDQLDTMVSEVAHDVEISLTPALGYQVSGVFGVPDAMMEQGQDGTILVRVPTAFMATTAGGIYLTLGKDTRTQDLPERKLPAGTALLQLGLRYVSALDGGSGGDQLAVYPRNSKAGDSKAGAVKSSAELARAMLLVEQFTVMRAASLAFHRDGKPKESFRLLTPLLQRLALDKSAGMAPERKLVRAMRDIAAKMSGYQGEYSQKLIGRALDGGWQVVRTDGSALFTPDAVVNFEHGVGVEIENADGYTQSKFEFDGKTLKIEDPAMVLTVAWKDTTLVLSNRRVHLELRRVELDY